MIEKEILAFCYIGHSPGLREELIKAKTLRFIAISLHIAKYRICDLILTNESTLPWDVIVLLEETSKVEPWLQE